VIRGPEVVEPDTTVSGWAFGSIKSFQRDSDDVDRFCWAGKTGLDGKECFEIFEDTDTGGSCDNIISDGGVDADFCADVTGLFLDPPETGFDYVIEFDETLYGQPVTLPSDFPPVRVTACRSAVAAQCVGSPAISGVTVNAVRSFDGWDGGSWGGRYGR
jgi:hypothetical protein